MAVKLASKVDYQTSGSKKNQDDTSTTLTQPITIPMTFESYFKSQDDKIENQKNQNIINAQNTYRNTLSTYGANAEALSRMGLQGSGYGKYLDTQASAQRQSAINAANAEARAMHYKKLSDALTNLTVADINRLGVDYELTADQIASLKEAKRTSVYNELSQRDYTAEELKARMGDLRMTDYERLKENLYNPNNPNDDISEASFAGLTMDEAQDKLNEILENPNVSEEVKDKWRIAFYAFYLQYDKQYAKQ